MADKSIIIIGAGVAGLATGCYGQMNGYSTQIFEMHSRPGGLCTAWERKGYTIDGCLHWLVGTSPNSAFRTSWEELGALQGKQIINMDIFCRVESREGKTFTLYTDPVRLEQELKMIAPEDSDVIKEFTEAIRRMSGFEPPADKAPELSNAIDKLKMLGKMRPYLGVFRKWQKISMKNLALRFQNPFLREVFETIWIPEMPAISIIMTLALLSQKNAGYVIGGSDAVAKAIEQRYLNLKGKIDYNSKIVKIIVENDRAIGVKLENGAEYKADYVISASDGHATIFDLLEGKYVDETIKGYYANMPIFKPIVYVALGVNQKFEDLPNAVAGIHFLLDKPIKIGGQEHKRLGVHIYNHEPAFSPEGKNVLASLIESDFAYWETLRKDPVRYNAEKQTIANEVISVLDKHFPGLANNVEMIDVETPYTFYRYTGNWQGCYEGWLVTPENMMLQMKKTLPGLDKFYLVGQWVSPGGGLPSGLITGRHVIQLLNAIEKKKFVTTISQDAKSI